ncbi:PREDICTED: 11-beta-hydroxysteroid dehydrogenase 1B-like [Nelumbo nucifera]|uniref:11-beta-hydroxysteroid dehydrogenase 1B-like n=2 Tax=Nelumbo nucifera TaxID=4432 RepID=A0A1U8BC16_NELNU|nr:PREDICTED: 11-beta-hydroxysteroid dehydrogenase 1B-like [Nelumbo nucifera]DAD32622.1 TPA_asm: hypothetical protein HUJ06_011473 [Nelumbo nucifera]
MDNIHSFLNLVSPPIAFLLLCLTFPLLIIFRFIRFILAYIYMENMAGKVVLITGASSGIGEHLAYEYAKRGASLVLVARRENYLRVIAEKCRLLGSPHVLVVPADVSKVDDCQRFVEETVNQFGRLDHLVCNAGIDSFCLFKEAVNVANFTSVMDINFWGSIYPTRFAIPHLKRSRGKIVVNASATGWLVSPWSSVYGASKAALLNFYETLRVELAPEIKITTVAPGFIESEMIQGKHLTNEGEVKVDQKMKEIVASIFPVQSTGKCAKAIVDGTCRGDRYVIEPSWFRVLVLFQFVCPGLVEWLTRFLYIPNPGKS